VRLSGSSSLGADAGITGFSLSLPRSGSHQLRPAWAGCLDGCEARRPSRHPNRPHRQLIWPDDADRPRALNSRPELPIPNAAAQTRIVSVARIRLDSWKSVRPFKEIFCDDIFGSSSPTCPASQSSLCGHVRDVGKRALEVERCGRTRSSPSRAWCSSAGGGRKRANFFEASAPGLPRDGRRWRPSYTSVLVLLSL
jgi:hypothetical protein